MMTSAQVVETSVTVTELFNSLRFSTHHNLLFCTQIVEAKQCPVQSKKSNFALPDLTLACADSTLDIKSDMRRNKSKEQIINLGEDRD